MTQNYISKNNFKFLGVTLILMMCSNINAQTTLVFEDFEDATVGYTLRDESNNVALNEDISQAFADEDYFGRIALTELDPADNLGFTNIQGIRFFGANDYDSIDTAPFMTTSDLVSINWSNIDITGFSNISVSAFFAEGDSQDGLEDWDGFDGMRNASIVRVEYSFDNITWTPIFSIVGSDVNSTNTFPVLDADNNNVGDGAEVNETFVEISGSFESSGNSTVSIRVFMEHLTGTDEDIAIDNFTITGDNTLSTEEITFNNDISYQNPVIDNLVINSSTKISTIEVYDLTGKLVGISNSKIINLEFLTSGLYIANIISELNQSTTIKIVKQ